MTKPFFPLRLESIKDLGIAVQELARRLNLLSTGHNELVSEAPGAVSNTTSGLAPQSPGDATEFLNGDSSPAYAHVKDSDLAVSDVIANDVASTAHGFAPKSPADATKFLNGAAAPAYAAVKESDLATSDVTTNDVSSTKHGLAPKSPADATKFLNGAATPAYAAVKDSDLSTSDIATNDVSITKHGFTPKAPNDTTKFLRGDATWAVPVAGASGVSSAVLTDLTDLIAWYSADYASNTVDNNTGEITVFADKSGGGRAFTPGSGRVQKQYAGLAGLPIASFVTGLTANAQVTLPLKGALTIFAVMKIVSSANYQNIIAPGTTPADPTDLHLYWDQPTNKWQIDGHVTPTANVSGRWLTYVGYYYNVGSDMTMQVRENGALLQAAIASTVTGHPVPGSGGSPSNYDLRMFYNGGFPFVSQIAEWGFYAVSKSGSEATLESYLRARYGTW